VRTQGLAFSDGRVRTSVNIFDPVTFAPISNIQNNADGSTERWSFRGLVVEGVLNSGGQNVRETTRSLTLAEPAYDFNCCMRSLLPAAVRLRLGETFTVNGVVEAGNDPSQVTFHVIARERVRAGYRGMIDAWVVQTDVPGGGIAKFWIADTAPFVVRMRVTGVPANLIHGVHFDQAYDMLG
jgi:hypothetical protein